MKYLSRNKFIGLILAVFIIASIAISSAFSFNSTLFVNGEVDNSSDAGVLNIVDDFRFNGLNSGKIGVNFSSFDNVCTAEYGSYAYGLIPAAEFKETVDAGTGFLIYTFNLEGNGVFLLIRTLKLSLTYNLKNANDAKIRILYSVDDGEYVLLNENVNNASFDSVLSSLEEDSTANTLNVKIELVHDSENINIDGVSINLYKVEFTGMQNFVMKRGASIKQALGETKDLYYRAFIAKDCYTKLNSLYSPDDYKYVLGNIIFAHDNIIKYNVKIEKDYIYFNEDTPRIKNYPSPVTNSKVSFNGTSKKAYTITVNDVEYYYFDGAIRNIKSANIARDFISKSYIRVVRGTEQVFFALASFNNQNVQNNSRSAYYVSQKILESTPEMSKRFNDIIFSRLSGDYFDTFYTVRKFYVDSSFNVISVQEDTFDAKLNSIIALDNDYKSTCSDGFTYIGDNGVIKDGDTSIYSNSFCNKVYPLGKSLIDLYYLAD